MTSSRWIGSLLGALLASSAAPSLAITLAETLIDDATLHDVQMLDARRGWAVGDHGAILATEDGGASWGVMPSPTDATLHAVCFIDGRRGWAVGGTVQPHTRKPTGVVLFTDNGGRTWAPLRSPTLPVLTAVRFFDGKHGMAAGLGTAFSPGGVFETDDGGKSWRTLAADRLWAWNTAAFDRRGRESFAQLAGPRGGVARSLGGRIEPSEYRPDRRGVRRIARTAEGDAWLVGDGGLVRSSDDDGKTWRDTGHAAAAAWEWFDWQALAVHDAAIWAAGFPGSVVVRSEDGGRTWSEHPTGITTPLCAIDFVDSRHGVAVGEFGVVLTTADGGVTWTPRRGASRHASVLVLAGSDEHLAPELLAATSLAAGRRTVLAAPTTAPEAFAVATERHIRHGVCQELGLAAARGVWRLPAVADEDALSQSRLVAALDQQYGGSATEAARREVARLLAAYRPSVVLTPSPSGLDGGLAAWISGVTVRAATEDFDFPEATRLVMHQPRQVLAVRALDGHAAGREPGANRFSTGDFIGALGATTAQWSAPVRGLLAGLRFDPPDEYSWTPLVGRPVAARRGDLGEATASPRGAPDRRLAADPPAGQIDQLRRLTQRKGTIAALLDVERSSEEWSTRVLDLTMGLDDEAGAQLVEQLARGYLEVGKADLAADTRFLLARRYPGEPLAEAGLVWLLRYYASTECAHAAVTRPDESRRTDALANVPSKLRFGPDAESILSSEKRRERAAALAEFLQANRPVLFAEPSVRLTAAANRRAEGEDREAERVAEMLARQAGPPAWRRAAAAERWLADAKSLPPEKPVATCRLAESRPKLDGRLDEPAWADADTIELRDASGVTQVKTYRDAEFLYLSVVAPVETPPASDDRRRPRDARVEGFDHLRLRLDVDRDYTTAYELAIDCRGFTRDSVWGDPHWRPEWYVARAADRDSWRIEAAIALVSLAEAEALEHAAWAMSVERRRPGEPTVSWTGDSGETPDAYGLLLLR